MAYILLTAVALFFLNYYATNSVRTMIFEAQHRSMEDKAQLLSRALLQLEELSTAEIRRAVQSIDDLHSTRTVVTDPAGTALYDSQEEGEGKLLLFPELCTALRGQNVFYGRYRNTAVESRVALPLMQEGKLLGAIYLMEYNEDQGRLVSALQTNVLRISVALELGIILFSLVFSAAFSRRLRRILNSVRHMRDGDYSQKLRLRGHDELAHLGSEFNNLAERLDDSEQKRRQFVSDASHELKTPLATMKLLADSILQNEMDRDTQREFIEDIGREADRLGRLTQKLLMLTKLDSAIAEDREILDAAPTVRKVVRTLQPLADLRNISIEYAWEKDCIVMSVEDDLHQIVFNLTENAIKYNRDGGWVGISLQKTENDVILVVADRGVGIPADAMPHIFDRFYRVDKARSRAAGGAGLGLSIVYDMVQRNYGSISVEANPGGGTRFTVTFPLFELPDPI